jgi:circadian clock protein KaiC
MAESSVREADGGAKRISTGIRGLDHVLGGGLTPHRLYLVEGDPGSGKTTLALQFLLEGARLGEPGLYVSLSETREELEAVAASHGWDISGVGVCELAAPEEMLRPEAQYTMFHPSEVELSDTTRAVLDQVEKLKPRRVAFDSLSEMRLLAQNPLRYRRQILALKQFFIGRSCTVVLLDNRTSNDPDRQLRTIAHGVFALEQLAPEYGAARRRLRVVKMRGVEYRGGYHDFVIKKGGLRVFPRLIAAEHHISFEHETIPSGVTAIDKLLGGGLDRGTSTLLVGPAGTGKSSLATQYVAAAAERGHASAIFTFDESLNTLLKRSEGLGIPIADHIKSGLVEARQVDPAELSPGEFADLVQCAVEERHARVVVIDSLNGYLNAMPDERYLTAQLHELLTYLGQRGVTTLMIVAQHGLLGTAMQTAVDASYLADGVIVLRYFEAAGGVRQAVSVMKKRSGAHERSIRELRLSSKGIEVSEPLREFHGVLSGIPEFLGPQEQPPQREAPGGAHDAPAWR